MHKEQIRIEKGIRFVDGKYQVNIDYTKDNYSKSLHLGSFDNIEKARNIRAQAVELRQKYKSSEISFEEFMKELLYIKSTYESLYAPRCCGIMKKRMELLSILRETPKNNYFAQPATDQGQKLST